MCIRFYRNQIWNGPKNGPVRNPPYSQIAHHHYTCHWCFGSISYFVDVPIKKWQCDCLMIVKYIIMFLLFVVREFTRHHKLKWVESQPILGDVKLYANELPRDCSQWIDFYDVYTANYNGFYVKYNTSRFNRRWKYSFPNATKHSLQLAYIEHIDRVFIFCFSLLWCELVRM